MLNEKSIFRAIVFVPIIFVFFVSSSISYFFIQNDYQYLKDELQEIESRYIESQKEFIKNEIDSVVSYVDYKRALTEDVLKKNIQTRTLEAYNIAISIYEKEKNRKSINEITQIVIDVLREIKFNNGRGYYFGLDKNGVAVLFADRPHLENKNLMNTVSQDGARPIEDIVTRGFKEKSGFYEYLWSKPNAQGTNHRKIAYFKLIEPLGWVVGTGEYFDDVESDIKNEILDRIKNIRFGKNGYIFVLNSNGDVLVHPMFGTNSNILNYKDAQNFEFVQEFINIAKSDREGYIDYYLNKLDNSANIDKKLSFIKYYNEWDWIVGTGIYFDEITRELNNKRESFKNRIHLYQNYLIIFALIGGTLITTLSYLFAKMINRVFNHYKKMVKEKELELLKLNRELENRIEVEINKRREKEQMLIQQNKMAQMGEMINSIAHQWRQPLNILALKIQDLPESYEYGELDMDSLNGFVSSSMNQIQFMSSTIDDFRNFFKPNKNREEFSISPIIDEVLGVLGFDARFKNIKIVKNCSDFTLNLYKNEFKQVLLNLINNSKDEIIKKDTTFQGEIRIISEIIDNKKVISIEDNGGGVPEEIIDRIFEPYFTTKEKTQGTGIGLYMSKMIIERNMGGILSVVNIKNGAKFTISFDE